MMKSRSRGLALMELLVAVSIGIAILTAVATAIVSRKRDSEVQRIASDFAVVKTWAQSQYHSLCRTAVTGTTSGTAPTSSNAFGQALQWTAVYDFSSRATGAGNLEIRLNVNALSAAQRTQISNAIHRSEVILLSGITYVRVISQGAVKFGGTEQNNFRLMYQSDRC